MNYINIIENKILNSPNWTIVYEEQNNISYYRQLLAEKSKDYLRNLIIKFNLDGYIVRTVNYSSLPSSYVFEDAFGARGKYYVYRDI